MNRPPTRDRRRPYVMAVVLGTALSGLGAAAPAADSTRPPGASCLTVSVGHAAGIQASAFLDAFHCPFYTSDRPVARAGRARAERGSDVAKKGKGTPVPVNAELRRALDRAGWSYTRQRAAVFEHLRAVDTHPAAEEIFSAVRQRLPRISLATVYKALDALVASGLANKLVHTDGPARYDCRRDAHYHLRCVKSGRIRDLETPFDPQLLDKLDPTLVESLRRQGFRVLDYRLELVGQFEDN